jgi:hypothetical protein
MIRRVMMRPGPRFTLKHLNPWLGASRPSRAPIKVRSARFSSSAFAFQDAPAQCRAMPRHRELVTGLNAISPSPLLPYKPKPPAFPNPGLLYDSLCRQAPKHPASFKITLPRFSPPGLLMPPKQNISKHSALSVAINFLFTLASYIYVELFTGNYYSNEVSIPTYAFNVFSIPLFL